MNISNSGARRITKPAILITSIGRTGTQFFARLFAELLPDSTTLHEPDIFQNTGVESPLAHYLLQVRRAGIWRMLFLKALGKWTLVSVSDSRFLGRLDEGGAVRRLIAQRKAFVEEMPGSAYVESNIGYYGLLDIIPAAFGEHRAIYIVRDGRDWVRSHMNLGEFYGKRGFRKLISHNWPTASEVAQDPYAQEWHGFSRFEKLCWAWSKLNEYALASLSKNSQARLFGFEAIFAGDDKDERLYDLVSFATSLSGIRPIGMSATAGWLERKINQSNREFPAWEEWSLRQKDFFRRICGPLMERLGYAL